MPGENTLLVMLCIIIFYNFLLFSDFLRSNTNPPTQSGRSSQNKGPIPKKQKLFSPTYVVGNAQQTKQSCYRLPKKRPAGPGHRSQVWTPKLVCINDGKLSTNNLTAENCNQALLLAKDGTAAVPRPNIVPIPNQSKDFLPKPTVAPVSKTGEVPMARHPVTEQGKMLMGRLSENQGWPRNNSDIDTRVGIRPKMNTVYCVSLLNQESQKPNPLADPELENSESLKKAFNLTKPMEKQNHVPSPSSPVDLSTKDTSCSSSDPADYPRRDFNIKEEATKVLYRDYEKNTMSDTSKQGDEVTITSQNADLNSVKNFHKCKIGSGIMSDSDTTATVVSDTFATVGSDICADDISEGTETETDIDTTDDCRGSTVKASTDLISDKAVNERSTATDTEKVTDDKLAMLNDSTTGLDRARTVTKTTETVTQTTTGTCNGLENDRTSSLNTITKEIKDTCNDFATEFDDTLVVTDSIVNGDKENVSRMVESCSATSVTTYFKTSDSSAVGEENEAGTVKDHSNELESVSQRNDDRKGTTDEDLSNQLENAPKPNSNTETVKDKDLSNEIEISSKATCDSKSDEVIEMDKCKPINSKTSLSPESPEIMTDSNVPTVDITTSASMNICLEQKRNIDSSSDAKLRGPEDTTAKTAPGLKSVDVGLEKVELEKSSASKLKDIHFDIAAPGSVSAGVDVGIPKGSDLNTAVLDSAINYAASSLSEIETYTYVKDTKKTFGSVNVMSEVTIPNKNTASDANFTSLAADFNAHNLLNGNIPNSVSASLTIDKDSIATSTNLETVSGMVANMSPTNKGRNNKSPLLTDDENITSFIKLEPDDSSISEFIENLELQPMKMEDQENTVLKTPETVLEGTVNTSLNEVNEVRETANKISADGSNDDTIIVEIVEPAMDDTVDNGVRQIVPTGTIIMGSGGNQYIVGEGFDGNKIIGRSRGRPSKYVSFV